MQLGIHAMKRDPHAGMAWDIKRRLLVFACFLIARVLTVCLSSVRGGRESKSAGMCSCLWEALNGTLVQMQL
jgi:hypothetical protein